MWIFENNSGRDKAETLGDLVKSFCYSVVQHFEIDIFISYSPINFVVI